MARPTVTIAAELIDQARTAGIELIIADDQVVARGTGQPDPQLLEQLRRHRDQLHAHLTGHSPGMPADGTITDTDGNTWRLQCRCGLHPNRGHDARPIPATTEEP